MRAAKSTTLLARSGNDKFNRQNVSSSSPSTRLSSSMRSCPLIRKSNSAIELKTAILYVHLSDCRMERQRLRALAGVNAAVDLQRTWRGACGRYAARKHAAILHFARIVAEGYADPSRVAQANLRAFNSHKGFVGHAGVDARSLLAAAAGGATEVGLRSGKKELVGVSRAGPCGVNLDMIRLRLKQDNGDRGIHWNGESGCHYGDGVGGGGISAAIGGIADVDVRVRLVRKRTGEEIEEEESLAETAGKQSTGSATVASNREFGAFDSSCKARKRQRVLNDCPPTTLKLELISVEARSDPRQERVTARRGKNDSRDGSVIFCEVTWCGEAIGGTRSPPGGCPIPRWEGQVFHLPLSAMSCCSSLAKTNANDCNSSTGRQAEEQRGPDKNRRGGVRGEAESPRPPLLTVTLYKLVTLRDDRGRLYDCSAKRRNNSDRRDTSPNDRSVTLDAWSTFILGFSEPEPVARGVLEAGDVLCMLGSQQVRSRYNNDIP